MNKKIALASAAIGALGAAHSAFWVYQSGKIKFSIEQAAGKLSKEVGRKNTEFFYTSSEISGYPLNFTIRINQPKFISAGGGEKIEITSGDEPVVIISNLLGNGYRVNLPAKFDIKQTVEEKEKSYKLEFTKEAPQIEAKFSGNLLFDISNSEELLPYLGDKMKSFRYSDSGYTLTNIEDSAKVSSSESNLVQITKSSGKTNSISTAYNIKMQNVDSAALFAAENNPSGEAPAVSGLWPVTTSIDFSSIDSKDDSGKSNSVDFIVRDIDIKAATFGVGIKGSIKANGNDIFPFGDLSVKINGYQNMVDYFGGVVSEAFAQTKIPLFHIKSEKSIDFKKVLYDVASEKSNEDKDILLTITREQGKSLFIGQKGLMEVIDLLKASAATAVEPAREGASIQQKAPVLDLSPSAGMPAAPAPLVLPTTK